MFSSYLYRKIWTPNQTKINFPLVSVVSPPPVKNVVVGVSGIRIASSVKSVSVIELNSVVVFAAGNSIISNSGTVVQIQSVVTFVLGNVEVQGTLILLRGN